MSPNDPLAVAFRLFAPTEGPPSLGGTSYRRTTVGDLFVEGAYVYRAAPIVLPSAPAEMAVLVRDKATKTWCLRSATLTYQEGLLQEVVVEGYQWPHRRSKDGITTTVYVPDNVRRKGDGQIGDVTRLRFENGRLTSVADVAEEVPIEGVPGVTA